MSNSPSDQDWLIKTINLEFPVGEEVRHFQIQLDLNAYSQKSMWIYFNDGKLYEPETSQLFIQLLREGDTFIDLGGHIGYYTLLARTIVGPGGQGFVFEPERDNREHLVANILRNGFANIQVCEYAVGDAEQDLSFYLNADNDGGHAFWDISQHALNEKSRQHLQTCTVHQTTLDHYFRNTDLGPLRLIKMDIEGSEFKALLGARQTLQQYDRPAVILEMNRFALRHMGSTEDDIRRFMAELGYKPYALTENGLLALREGEYYSPEYVFNMAFLVDGRL